MAIPSLVSSSVDLFGTALTTVWSGLVTQGGRTAVLSTGDSSPYEGDFSSIAGGGTTTLVDPLSAGGAGAGADGVFDLPSGYAVSDGDDSAAVSNEPFSVTGIVSATFNLCTNALRVVWAADIGGNWLASGLPILKIATGTSYVQGVDDPNSTTVNSTDFKMVAGTGSLTPTNGTVALPAEVIASDVGGTIPNIAVTGVPLTEVSGILSASVDLFGTQATIEFAQAEFLGDETGVHLKTADGSGLVSTTAVSGDGGTTHVYNLEAGAGAAAAGTLDLDAATVNADGTFTDNLAVAGVPFTVTGIVSATFNLCTQTIRLVTVDHCYSSIESSFDNFRGTLSGDRKFHAPVEPNSSDVSGFIHDYTTEIVVGDGSWPAAGYVDWEAYRAVARTSDDAYNIAVAGFPLTEDSGIISATFDEATLKLTIVFAQEEAWFDVFYITTAAGVGYTVDTVISGDGSATHVYAVSADVAQAANGTLEATAHAWETTVGSTPNLAITGVPLTEVQPDSVAATMLLLLD